MRYTHTETGETKTHQQWQNDLGMSFHADRLPEFLRVPSRPEPVQPTPEQALSRKQKEVRNAAAESYREPVTLADGTTWNGGFDSAAKINGAVDLEDFAGSTRLILTDLNDDEHDVTIHQAKTIAAGIGAVYQVKHRAKQAAMRALKAVDLQASDAIDQLNAITFEAHLQALQAPPEQA